MSTASLRPITWLHVSDFHLRESQAWSQDVVLSAMTQDIARRRKSGMPVDFVLATGDLAYAGKEAEYTLAGAFLDNLTAASGVPRERIFCVPGNHDVQRDRQTLAFAGARHRLQSPNDVDSLLGSAEELETLGRRLENFRAFQATYFRGQSRTPTPDGLGYVSHLEVGDVRIALVGLNSAWLAEGGMGDHGKLLLGERQVIDALAMARSADAHIVVGMGHHPFSWLSDFDRGPVQRKIEAACHFFHCGHLHEAEARDVAGPVSRCLTLVAGASFESRHAHNAYSIISLDLFAAMRQARIVQYKPADGAFSYESDIEYSIDIDATSLCSVRELGKAIESFHPPITKVAYYLSALLLEAQAEIPVPVANRHVFAAVDVLSGLPDSEIKTASRRFMAFANTLKLFFGRMRLEAILATYGRPVAAYGELLVKLGDGDGELGSRLTVRDREARIFAGVEPVHPFEHTMILLNELRSADDWHALQEQAARHMTSPVPELAVKAKRLYALCLSRSTEQRSRTRAVEIYGQLSESDAAEAGDIAARAHLLASLGDHEAAKQEVLLGIERFPTSAAGFAAIGQTIVEATGDRAFRDTLRAHGAERGRP